MVGVVRSVLEYLQVSSSTTSSLLPVTGGSGTGSPEALVSSAGRLPSIGHHHKVSTD